MAISETTTTNKVVILNVHDKHAYRYSDTASSLKNIGLLVAIISIRPLNVFYFISLHARYMFTCISVHRLKLFSITLFSS